MITRCASYAALPVWVTSWCGSGGTAAMVGHAEDELARRRGRPSGAVAAVTHERLVKIAREVFSQCGYDGTTFAEVARRAGLSRAALHYHFADKRALYHDVIKSTYTGVVAPAIDRAAQETGLGRQLSVFIEAAGGAIAQERSVAAFLCTSVAECQRRPELRDPKHCPVRHPAVLNLGGE